MTMFEKIKALFTNNILWKGVALVMAVMLWLIAVNIEDPVLAEDYLVPLQIIGMDALNQNDLVLLNEDALKSATIRIRVRATRKVLTTRLSKSNISAYIDMKNFTVVSPDKIGKELPIQIDFDIPQTLEAETEILKLTPSSVNVILDYYETKEVPVNIIISKKPAQGYVAGEAALDPSVINVSGAKSILDSIETINVEASLDGATEDYQDLLKPVVTDINDNDITNKVKLSALEVSANIPIYKQGRIPVKKPEIIGYAANGYTITNVKIDPEFIDVVGKAEEIEALKEIAIEPVSISGASSDQVFTRDVRDFLRPTNLNVKNGTPHEVTVTVFLEREITKTLSVESSTLAVIGDRNNATFDEEISVQLKGVERVMASIDDNGLSGSFNIENLEQGTHYVDVEFILPEGVTIVGETPQIKVIIGEAEEAETQPPTETNIPPTEEPSEPPEEEPSETPPEP
ncbi:MAG: hypothetical protein E7234_08940 [Lachnospiraceae bacterium]|nr:hypothetical protein [Lachnospiraceae bacterium]